MKLVNKIALSISSISILMTGFSLYYHNKELSNKKEIISKTSENIKSEFNVEKIKLSNKNFNILTAVENNILKLELTNVSGVKLQEVILEVLVQDKKISEVYIEKMENNDIKTIYVPLSNQVSLALFENNSEINNEYRLLETQNFNYLSLNGLVNISSLQIKNTSFYVDKVKTLTISETEKSSLIKLIENTDDFLIIEKLLYDNKMISKLSLSNLTDKFNIEMKEYSVKENNIYSQVAQSSNSINTTRQNGTNQTETNNRISSNDANRIGNQNNNSNNLMTNNSNQPNN